MVASRTSVERVVTIMLTHVPYSKLTLILRDLKDVPGNKSFRDTIESLDAVARDMHNREMRASRKPRKRTASHEDRVRRLAEDGGKEL